MNKGKPATMGLMTKRPDHAPGPRPGPLSKPTILDNRPLPKVNPLPSDFDFTLHTKVLATGQVKPATPADFAQRIAELKQRKKTSLG